MHRESSELKDGRVLGVFRGAALRVTDVPGAEQGRGLEGDDVTDAAVNPVTVRLCERLLAFPPIAVGRLHGSRWGGHDLTSFSQDLWGCCVENTL